MLDWGCACGPRFRSVPHASPPDRSCAGPFGAAFSDYVFRACWSLALIRPGTALTRHLLPHDAQSDTPVVSMRQVAPRLTPGVQCTPPSSVGDRARAIAAA